MRNEEDMKTTAPTGQSQDAAVIWPSIPNLLNLSWGEQVLKSADIVDPAYSL